MKRLLLLLIISFVLIGNICAQTDFTINDLMKIRRVGDPQLSPDGQWVAFTMGDVDVEANRTLTQIYLIPIGGGEAKQLTTGNRSHSSPRWSPDGKRLAFNSGGQIWIMNSDGEGRKQLTKLSTGAVNPVWSPDGRFIAFTSEVYPECNGDDACNKAEDEKAENSKVQAKVTNRLLYRHWTEWRTRKRTHVFFISTAQNGLLKDVTPGDFDSPPFAASTGSDYVFSPDSRKILILKNTDKIEAVSTNSDIFQVPLPNVITRNQAEVLWRNYAERILANPNPKNDLPKDSISEIINITRSNKGYDAAPQYTSDGKYIIYRSQATEAFEADRWRIMRLNRQTGETVELTSGFDLQADEFIISPDNQTIYFTAVKRGLAPIFTVPVEPNFRLRIATHVKQLISEGFNSGLNITPDGKTLVFSSSSLTMPSEVFTVQTESNARPVQLTKANSKLDFLQKADELEWKGAMEKTIHGFLLKPPNFDANRKYPLMVLIHGGPQSAFSNSWGYRWNPQIFANAGYVVFQPNPRGSVGYGQQFVNEVTADWGGKAYTDIMNGVAEVAKKTYIDKQNIGAAGASYGGYMIDWILGHNNDPRFKFKALLSHAGVYNLENMATVTEELWFVNWEFKGMPWQNPVNYEKWSPHRFIKNFQTPTLVTQGELDYRVPVDQSLQLFTALQLNGVDSKLIVFPDEGHWILKPQNSIFWYKEVLEWFEKHLK